jgi:mono/diheme cytochrome c family protein
MRIQPTLIGTVALLLGASLAVLAANPGGDAANGRRLFMTYGCYECHGTTGAGGGIAGPKLAPNPLPLEGIKAKLRTPSGRMPVYTKALVKDADIADIFAYLQSIPTGQSAQEIPLLSR